MNTILNDMIKDYDLKDENKINIAEEVIQKVCLSALSRADFLQKLHLWDIHV